MRTMILVALFLSCIPMFLAFLLPNWYLGDTQNAIEETDLVDELASEREFSDD